MDILKKLDSRWRHITCKDLEGRAEGEEQEESVWLDQSNWGQVLWAMSSEGQGVLSELLLSLWLSR